jgi:S-DNA-T family DNA segregation ATPase FtsK/SpoIIIE
MTDRREDPMSLDVPACASTTSGPPAELTVVAVLPDGRRQAALVRTESGAMVAEVAAALAGLMDEAQGSPPLLYVDGVPVPADTAVSEGGMVHGALVGLGVAVADSPLPAVGLEVAVVGGPAAGAAVVAVPGRTITVGRAVASALPVSDPEVSRTHATLAVADDGRQALLEDNGSRNGINWAGYRLEASATMAPGDVAQVGESVIALRTSAAPAPVLEPGKEPGTVRYNRPPRITPPVTVQELVVPAEPEQPNNRRFPVAAILFPLALGAVLLVFMGPNPYLFFIALSPFMMLFNIIGDRRGGRADYRKKKAEYDQAMGTLDDRMAEAVAADEKGSRVAHPDPGALLSIACGPTGRLWERRVQDPDFLHLRVGLADRPAAVRVRHEGGRSSAQDDRPAPVSRLVPVTIDVPDVGVLGVAGPRPTGLGAARAMVAQAATLHGPRDLRLVVITGAEEAPEWEWTTWLPHMAPAEDGGPRRATAAGVAQAEARLNELAALVAARAEYRRDQMASGLFGARVLVVLDGARRMRSLSGLAEVLQDGPAEGVYALCLDRDEASLPSECQATAVTDGAPTRMVVRRPAGDPVEGVLADALDVGAADRLARALAPVRDLGGDRTGEGSVPARVRFVDVVLGETGADAGAGVAGSDSSSGPGESEIEPRDVIARWRSYRGGRSTRALLGVAADGPFSVDLVTDGPHALVAGTTGSGKSELLQTLVASLALGNRPDQLHVVLVDYKGGAAFSHCAGLPHCVGMVTDLDGRLSERALISFTAELKRRERLLAGVGAKDIDGYWAATDAPLPRLVIVIDEFATLVEEVPDFVKGIVGVGMRGRSLGVHVVLATQRPAGVVTGDLRANVNLRLCLRVADPSESSDVLDVSDAARIPTSRPGRAYARTGHRELTVFQTARVGGPRPGTVDASAAYRPVEVEPWRFSLLGEPVRSLTAEDDQGDEGETDLAGLVRAVQAAAEAEGVAPQEGPWLPPLPELVTLDRLDPGTGERTSPHEPMTGERSSPVVATIGLADLPAAQDQQPFSVDLERTGSLLIVGSVRSGRSTALRTLASSLAAGSSPEALHLYVIDGGNRVLANLDALPHCGAVVAADDHDRVERLLAFLAGEIQQRQRMLSAQGFGSLAEQRAAATPGEALPHVVLLLDKLEAFQALYLDRDSGSLLEVLERMLREGPSVGITPVIATDRSGLTARLSSAVEHRLVLRQAERDDYLVAGIPPRSVPAHVPPGRAFWATDLTEVQLALLDPDPSGTAQGAAVAELAARAMTRFHDVPAGRLPRRIDPLPEEVTATEVEAYRRQAKADGAATCVLGVGGDELAPVDVDLADLGPAFVIAGPPRSGRSTALTTMVTSLGGRLPVVAIAPRPSPLRDLHEAPGVAAVLTDSATIGADLDEVVEQLGGGGLAVVIDDAELLGDGQAGVALERLVRTARDRSIVVVAAATTDDLLQSRFRGWLADARRSRAGLLLCPSSSYDGEVFDLKLPRSLSGGWPPGRGLLVARGSAKPVQVARVA